MTRTIMWALVGYAAYRLWQTRQQKLMPTVPIAAKASPLPMPKQPDFAIAATPFQAGPVRPVPPRTYSADPMPFIPTSPSSPQAPLDPSVEAQPGVNDSMAPNSIPVASPDLMIASTAARGSTPLCIPETQNIVVEDCPTGTERACARVLRPPCPSGQKANQYHDCGPCQ